MKQGLLFAFTFVAIASACSRVPPGMQMVNDAATALGGKERVLAVRSLVITGAGDNPNIGQNVTPDAPLNIWRVTDFTRSIDLVNGRMRLRQVRSARFPYTLATIQHQTQGIDGDVAFNVAEPGAGVTPTAVRASAAVAHDRRAEMLHNPVAAVRAALESEREAEQLPRIEVDQPSGRRCDDGKGRHIYAGRRRHDEASRERDDDERQREYGRRRHRNGVFEVRRRERAEAAEALHDEDGQVRAGGHGSGAERP